MRKSATPGVGPETESLPPAPGTRGPAEATKRTEMRELHERMTRMENGNLCLDHSLCAQSSGKPDICKARNAKQRPLHFPQRPLWRKGLELKERLSKPLALRPSYRRSVLWIFSSAPNPQESCDRAECSCSQANGGWFRYILHKLDAVCGAIVEGLPLQAVDE